MNGDDVAVIRNDIAHLSDKLDDWCDESKAILKAREKRVAALERYVAGDAIWKNGHLREHSAISKKLEKFDTDLADTKVSLTEIKESLAEMKGGFKKESAAGGVAGGASVAAIVIMLKEIWQQIIN